MKDLGKHFGHISAEKIKHSHIKNYIQLKLGYYNPKRRKEIGTSGTIFTKILEMQLVGISKYSGKEQIRNVFEYDAGVNSEIKLINCKFVGNLFTIVKMEQVQSH